MNLSALILGAFCLINIALFANLYLSMFKTNIELFANTWGFPQQFNFDNIIKLIEMGFQNYVYNSAIVLVFALFIRIFCASMVAYGLTRYDFKGRSILTLFFLVGLMFPAELGIIALSLMIRDLGLINTRLGLILVEAANMSLAVFILSNFLKTVPKSMSESARIDGANEFTVFTVIVLPMMRPALGAVIPLSMIGIWNNLFIPLVLLTREEVKTIPLGLMRFFNAVNPDLSRINLAFTAIALGTLPMLLLFALGSKQMINGITQGSVK